MRRLLSNKYQISGDCALVRVRDGTDKIRPNDARAQVTNGMSANSRTRATGRHPVLLVFVPFHHPTQPQSSPPSQMPGAIIRAIFQPLTSHLL